MRNRRLWIGLTVAVLAVALVVTAGFLWHHQEQQQLVELRNEALEKLERDKGQYDEQSIVLNGTSKAKAEELAELYGAELRITANGRFATLTLPEGTTIRDIYAMDESLKHIEDMAADYQVHVSEIETEEETDGERLPMRPQYSVSDTDYELQSYLDYLNMGNVWNNYKGNGITVAVIDTGIDTDHPEFAGRISEYSYNATEDKIVKDWDYDWSLIEDEVGHGTAVTGVIAATMGSGNVVGIAPNVNILVIKAECDEHGSFKRTSDLVFGLYYAIERDVQVVNMSFGTYDPLNPFEEAAQLAYDSDIICVAAAGNDSTSTLTYPAADPNVIGVGALGDGWMLAEYSNYGENTDLVAPGSTYTCEMGGGYATTQGTSLASPIVAGAIALYMQTDKYTTFDRVTEILYASCYDLGDLGRDWYYGFGALDISAFIMEARGTIIYDMLTDELENEDGIYIQGHTLQELPEPDRLYAVFDGWYYDDTFTQEYDYYTDRFYGEEITLYAKWANEDDGVPYTYVILDDGTVEIRSYTGHRRYITIPEKIDGRIVSSIGDFAFSGQTRLREVGLPSGLRHIGLNAFANCANLVSIQIPANVTEIEDGVFSGNVRLSSVAFLGNSKLETIGDFAFQNCGKMERIELPAALKSIDGSAFYGATALHTIAVQKGNTAFQSRDGVLFNLSGTTLIAFPAAHGNSYTLPADTKNIGEYAFAFAKIAEIDLANIENIGNSAFISAALESLAIPDSVTTMGLYAFATNVNLSKVTLGRGLTQVSANAFTSTSALKTITIPNGITSIGSGAFSDSGLQSVIFEENSSLMLIGEEAFYDCNISEIDIPASVLEIGAGAFSGWPLGNPLTRVGFAQNASLHTIGESAFAKCWLLEEIDLPASLRTIGDKAFMSTALKKVAIPANVINLGAGAFACCSNLTAITVETGNTVYHDIDGVVHNLADTEIHAFPAGKAVDTYYAENTVRTIMPWAFAGTHKLDSIVLPEGLTVVGEYGIYLSGINSVTLPETLEEIQQYALAKCSNLYSVHIPDNVLQIGRYAFADDWNLYSVTFNETAKLPRISFGAFAYCGIRNFRVPTNVSTMAQGAFMGCKNLTSFTFAANSKLESISAYMFDGCTNLQSITFEPGSALTSIQAHGLEGMDRLTSINFGDAKLTNVDNFAFRFCESLSTLNLPETVTNIGRYAFYGCKNLAELTIPKNVEHIGGYAFLATKDIDLYFVNETLPAYLDENWDHGTKGYYTGVTSVKEQGNWKYAILESGSVAVLKYLGEETAIDLSKLNLGAPITTIGGSAFEGSTVQTIVLPATLTAIQAEAFAYSDLEAITIPANVTFIGREAFAYTDITTLIFAAGSKLSVMEQYAFEGTKQLTSVILPKSLKTMGTGVFAESGLQSVVFENGIQITEIPQKAFTNTKLTKVILPDSVTLVNHNAFNNVQTLKSVTFGNNEGIRLMSNAFYHTGLETLHIPANVTYIGEYCFVALPNLKSFSVDENNPDYKAVDGLLLNKSGRKLIAVPAGRTGSLTVPKGVEEIGFGAFEESKLSEIKFLADANILTFGYRAFFKAENITSISIPKSVVSIDYYAFAYCENLQTVTFAEDNQLKGVYEGAFLGCINLENIVIPDTIVEISDFAFYGCSKIEKLPISENNNIKGIYDYAFAYTGLKGQFTTPETLWDIGNYAFLGTKLTKLTIPDTNKKILIIGIGAFEDCNQLTEITLPFIGASFEDEQISWFGYIFGAGAYEANETYVPKSLKTVTITDGITNIYIGGFAYCTGLETIHVPHSVSVLWNDAFRDVISRYELTNSILLCVKELDGTITHGAGEGHFGEGVSGEIKLADGVTGIYGAFINCSSLTSITIPNSVTSLNGAFRGCSSLTSITIPDSVTYFGQAVFMDCSSLTSITIPNGVTSIDHSAFSGCSSLTSITIPDSVTFIGEMAFSGCSNLTSITIPDDVTTIGNSAFINCSSLTSVTIGKNVTSIHEIAFINCDTLRKVINRSALQVVLGSEDNGYVAYNAYMLVDAQGNIQYRDNSYFETDDHFLFYYSGGTYTLRAYTGTEKVVTLPKSINGCDYKVDHFSGAEHIVIPDGIKRIDYGAFAQFSGLKSIVIPNSVTAIADNAFYNCVSLSQIVIPDNVKSIGGNAFYGCKSLTSIAIPKSVTSIGPTPFANCNKLETILVPDNRNYFFKDGILYDRDITQIVWVSPMIAGDVHILNGVTSIYHEAFKDRKGIISVTIPESVTIIGCEAFSNCSGLISVIIPNSVTCIERSAFSGCSNLESITIPNSVISIGNEVFQYCSSLKRITISERVTNIGASMFYGCDSLTSITIPSSVTDIGSAAFNGCSSLTSIVIPDSVTTIGSYAFDGCDGLTSIIIPDSVTDIGSNAFGGCNNLQEIIISENANFCVVDGILYNNPVTEVLWALKNISGDVTILDGVTSIGGSAFNDCGSLKSITFPDSVISIGNNAFANCGSLESIILPDSVTSIGYSAFYGCSSLKSIILPDSVTSIVEATFGGCSSLERIAIPDSVTSIGINAFANCGSLKSVTLGKGVTSIDGAAFINCNSLVEVVNNSLLPLKFKSTQNGYVAYYAYKLVDANGNVTYRDDRWFETDDHFLFYYSGGTYTLRAYIGSEEAVRLPESINGRGYRIYEFRGASNVIIPDGITSITDRAFAGNTSLKSITIPNSVTKIGSCAFENCSSLNKISIPASVISIGSRAFYACSGLQGDSKYLQNGMIVIDGWLIDVDEDVEYLADLENLRGAVDGAYENAYLLKTAIWGSNMTLPSNAETLYITSINSASHLRNLPLTLKNIVICDSVGASDLRACQTLFTYYNITGVTIYVEAPEVDLRWNDNFPGWNNGNIVVYGDKWNYVEFYDADGNMVSSELKRNSEIIRRPVVEFETKAGYTYELLGWDLDGDGVVDSVPATTDVNITAKAIVRHIHTHIFGEWHQTKAPNCTERGEEQRYCQYCDHYETREIMENGHSYTSKVTAPTCTEKGYTTHTCACGNSYVDSYVDKIDHSFTNYVSDGNATTEADGTKTALCDYGCGTKDTVTDEGSKITVSNITSDKYTVSGGYISKINAGTTAAEFLKGINEAEYIIILKNGQQVTATTTLGTGMVVRLMVGDRVMKEVEVVISGDTSGDGKITVTDMISVKSHVLKKSTLEGANAKAADVSGDGVISITDFIQIKSHILGKSAIKPAAVETTTLSENTVKTSTLSEVVEVTEPAQDTAAEEIVIANEVLEETAEQVSVPASDYVSKEFLVPGKKSSLGIQAYHKERYV